MKDIFIENGERKFKLVPNIVVDSLGQETVTVGVEEVAQAMTPGYEVKFLANPDLILDTSTKQPNAEFLALFTGMALKGTTKMSYYDTPDLALNNAGWTIRIRKKSNKIAQQCTFKKRYSKINKKSTLTQGDVNKSVKSATREGFNTLTPFIGGCEIDYGFSKCTLSYSADYNIAETGKGNTDIPDSATSIQFINANKPAIFTEDLSNIREHGAVTLTTYEGTFKGIVAVALDVMTIKDELGTGTETICEVTFKLEDYTGERYEKQTDLMLVNKLREEVRAVLVEKGYLLEKDGLKTNMILQRY
ncbi:hypothetical protein [Clostridium sp.]|uniref:hypothetical protein n=1 Tax=Clostridium sp. TaxID=1506 RepID=UPI0025C5E727|nr:hypothetical protein [Clostridium sp.]